MFTTLRWFRRMVRVEKNIRGQLLDIANRDGIDLVLAIDRCSDDSGLSTTFRLRADTRLNIEDTRMQILEALPAEELSMLASVRTDTDFAGNAELIVEWMASSQEAARAGLGFTITISRRGHFRDRSVTNTSDTLYAVNKSTACQIASKKLRQQGLNLDTAEQLADRASASGYASTVITDPADNRERLISVRIHDNCPWWARFLAAVLYASRISRPRSREEAADE
ncbi:Uncharacterised protein [Mycobacteroides abscessus]|uniref:Uncharacterized protein n=2 Tax=Mycobacteroides abscessus TaxID=36809 RepID=A0A0U0ZSZ4_9MYCO|nr:Uncharacterised protein [Mycobacteroides abscessus]